jgi:peptidoglycan/xylan/chitin deacetylase (PgdA/CDA1 family)
MSALVLLYHRVAELAPDPFGLCTPPERFRSQLATIAAHCKPVDLVELAATVPERAVAITLDDGYRDALDAAALLQEARLPATFFLNTDRLDAAHEGWWDDLARIFLGGINLPPTYGDLPTGTSEERSVAMRVIHDRLVLTPSDERDALLAEVHHWAGFAEAPRESHRLLVLEEVRRLSRTGLRIGAHGQRHLWLPSQSAERRDQEIRGCKMTLEALLDTTIDTYSYAYGGHDHDSVGAVETAGFTVAVMVEERPVHPGCDPLRIPRLTVPPLDDAAFAQWLDRMLESR